MPRRHVPRRRTPQGLQAARDDNRRAVDEACELQAACLVLVVGGLPGALAGKAAHKDIALARIQVRDGIAELLDYARSARMPLAIEPLHPMYAADRACINTLEQALDVCDELDPRLPAPAGAPAAPRWASPSTSTTCGGTPSCRPRSSAPAGAACWPSTSATGSRRPPTCSTTAGMMGDGVIDIPRIRGWVEDQGFAGYSEVEIFSAAQLVAARSRQVLDTCIERHRTAV